jgi:hypothetical protein
MREKEREVLAVESKKDDVSQGRGVGSSPLDMSGSRRTRTTMHVSTLSLSAFVLAPFRSGYSQIQITAVLLVTNTYPKWI